jgi:hypothetical protein
VYVTLEVSPRIIAGRLMQSLFSLKRREGDKATIAHFETDKTGKLMGIQSEEVDRPSLTSKAGLKKIKSSYASNAQVARISENLVIQSFPTGSLRLKGLAAYLENLVSFHRFIPEVVVLDMPDLMYLDIKNYRLGLGMLFKDLRGLAVDRNFALAAATQSNRASLKAYTITEGHTSEDISKIGIADVGISYNQTQEEKEVQVARLHIMIARNARDKWSACISQAYSLGQFCTGSIIVPPREWKEHLPKRRSAEYEDDEEEDE